VVKPKFGEFCSGHWAIPEIASWGRYAEY